MWSFLCVHLYSVNVVNFKKFKLGKVYTNWIYNYNIASGMKRMKKNNKFTRSWQSNLLKQSLLKTNKFKELFTCPQAANLPWTVWRSRCLACHPRDLLAVSYIGPDKLETPRASRRIPSPITVSWDEISLLKSSGIVKLVSSIYYVNLKLLILIVKSEGIRGTCLQ